MKKSPNYICVLLIIQFVLYRHSKTNWTISNTQMFVAISDYMNLFLYYEKATKICISWKVKTHLHKKLLHHIQKVTHLEMREITLDIWPLIFRFHFCFTIVRVHSYIMSAKGLVGSRKWPVLLTFSTDFKLTQLQWVGQKASKIMMT